MIDFRAVAAAALSRAFDLVPAWLPGGAKRGHEWVCGDLHGSPGESFSVNLHSGQWGDFAVPDLRGGDLISLYAAIHGIAQLDAAKAVAAECGMAPETPAGARPKPAPTEAADPWKTCRPVPLEAPGFRDCLDSKWGHASAHWVYRDQAGLVLMVVARWDVRGGDKEIRQFICQQHSVTGAFRWKNGWIDRPRPLYQLDVIAKNIGGVIIVCEGEKAADAAAKLLPGVVVTTSPGGASNGKHADWTALAGCDIIVWPDADETAAEYAIASAGHRGPGKFRSIDQSGSGYAAVVARECAAAGAVQVTVLDTGDGGHARAVLAKALGLSDLPRGFDAADIPTGTVINLDACITPAKADEPPRSGVGDERRKRVPSGEYHQALIDALDEYLTKREVKPDALDGWRDKNWNLVCLDVASIALDFAFEYRHVDGIAMTYVVETLDAMTRRRRAERRKKLLDNVLVYDAAPENALALNAWIRAVTGAEQPLDVAILRHWIWNAKRLILGLRTEHDIMPVIFGKQGSGKTTATERLALPLSELSIKVDASYLTDDRRSPVLAAAVFGRWEEMQGSQRADLEALKSTITYPTISYRPMRTTQTVVLPRTCSFMGTSNLPVDAMVQDTTGNRRFYQLTTPDRCDWHMIQDLDPAAIWRSVDPYGPCPLADTIHLLRDHQAELVHRDPVAMWLQTESWGHLIINRADSSQPMEINRYDPAKGETFEDLAMRFNYWCRTVGQTSIGSRAFGLRLSQENFVKRQRRENNARLWCYFRADATPSINSPSTHSGTQLDAGASSQTAPFNEPPPAQDSYEPPF